MSKEKALSVLSPCYHTEITVHCVCAEVDYRGNGGGSDPVEEGAGWGGCSRQREQHDLFRQL